MEANSIIRFVASRQVGSRFCRLYTLPQCSRTLMNLCTYRQASKQPVSINTAYEMDAAYAAL